VDPTTLLPPDDSAYGFDNVADVLGVNATLMEQYVSAAGKVSSLAVGDPDVSPAADVFTIPQDASQDRHVEGLPLGTIGGVLATPTIQVAGEYELSAKFFRTNLGVLRGLEYEHVLEYAVDGVRVHLTKMGGQEDWAANLDNNTLIADQIEERAKVRVPLTPGPHEITAAWIKKSDAIDPVRTTRPIRSSHDTRDPLGIPHLSTFTITGLRIRGTTRTGRCPDASRLQMSNSAQRGAIGNGVSATGVFARLFDRRVQAAHDPRGADGQSALCWREGRAA
jgi:hypothetical protein